MALLFSDGFDLYASYLDVAKGGWAPQLATTGTNTINFHPTNGRFGGGCLVGNSDNGGWVAPVSLFPGDTIIISWAYYHSGADAAGENFMNGFFAGGVQAFSVFHNNAGDVQARNSGNTQVGSTASGVMTASTWHWVEVKVVLGTDNTSGSIEVMLDGASIISATGIDTFANASGMLAGIKFQGGDVDWRVDDVIIMDGTGSVMNDFLGDSKIETLTPNADGTVTDWTNDYQSIDDPFDTPDDDSTYIASDTAGQESRFGFTNLASIPQDIYAVQVRGKMRKENAGARTVRGLINSDGTEETGPTKGLSTVYNWDRLGIFYEDPDTSLPWTNAGISAIQAGVEVVS